MPRTQISRRELLRGSMGGIALVSAGSLMPAVFVRSVFSREARTVSAAEGRVIVILQVAGGNDGLNTVVPYNDGLYYDARASLAISPEDVLPLNDRIGLHPAMTGLNTLWQEGHLAVVEGVGYPNPSRSHFRSMEIWHTANAEGVSYEGWLGKYLDATGAENGNLWRAVNVGSSLAPSLASDAVYVPTVSNINAYQLRSDPRYPDDHENRMQAWTALYAEAASEPGYLPLVSATGLQAFDSAIQLGNVASRYEPAVEYPSGPLGEAMKLVAQLIDSELGTGICYVTTGGFDTHAQQPNLHAALLGGLSDAILAFDRDLAAHGKGQDVVLVTWSEFGCRVKENGSTGTDHGTAGPLFVVGDPVQGGVYGEPSSLAELDNGDLRFTTAFRSVYATLLEEWLSMPSADVLGASFPTLGIFAGPPAV